MKPNEDDLDTPIWGVRNFAAVIKRSERQTFHLITSDALPAGTVNKVGDRYVSTKRKLLNAILGETAA